MKITYREFYTMLIGARLSDEEFRNIDLEGALWEQFAFGDIGVFYVEPEARFSVSKAVSAYLQ